MSDGSKADTNTPWLRRLYERGSSVQSPSGPLSLPDAITIMHDYFLYEFSIDGKVFYVGHTFHHVRSHGRWGHVKNLVRLEKLGTIPAEKLADLNYPDNRVIAALIAADLQERYSVSVHCPCLEKPQAKIEEMKRIKERHTEGCVLSNVKDLPLGVKPATVTAVLRYLNVTPETPESSKN